MASVERRTATRRTGERRRRCITMVDYDVKSRPDFLCGPSTRACRSWAPRVRKGTRKDNIIKGTRKDILRMIGTRLSIISIGKSVYYKQRSRCVHVRNITSDHLNTSNSCAAIKQESKRISVLKQYSGRTLCEEQVFACAAIILIALDIHRRRI